MPTYPLTFSVSTTDSDPKADHWNHEEGDALLQVAIPEEFGGSGNGYSPEDFLGMALTNCFLATFRVYAKLSKLSYEELEVSVSYDVDYGEKKQLQVTRAHFNVALRAGNEERMSRLLKKVSTGCIMLNSLKVEKTFDFKVNPLEFEVQIGQTDKNEPSS